MRILFINEASLRTSSLLLLPASRSHFSLSAPCWKSFYRITYSTGCGIRLGFRCLHDRRLLWHYGFDDFGVVFFSGNFGGGLNFDRLYRNSAPAVHSRFR